MVHGPVELGSTQIAKARQHMLKAFQSQLDEVIIGDKLKPQAEGIPFVNLKDDFPPLYAIKKLINCLYHAEIAVKYWEQTTRKNAIIKFPLAVNQLYKAIAVFDDATPELRSLIVENYNLLAPLFSKAQELLEKSGWAPQFVKMDAPAKASSIITQGMALLGPDLSKWNNENPLIGTFKKVSQLIHLTSQQQNPNQSPQEKQQGIVVLRGLLNDLNNNAVIQQLTISDLEESKALRDLFAWFKNIQEDGFMFTKKSLQEYLSWANHYLPTLILFTDQLERQNYFKSGLLSQSLCATADALSKQVNAILSEPSSKIVERVVTIDSLADQREQYITEGQSKSVKLMLVMEKNRSAAAHFFDIIRKYEDKSLDEITEAHRAFLRGLYPKVQKALAHASLPLENRISAVLNKSGPVQLAPAKKTFWQSAVANLGYVGRYVVNSEIDKLLKTAESVDQFLLNVIKEERFKVTIAEHTREKLRPKEKDKTPLEARVSARIKAIKSTLPKDHDKPASVIPKKFVPFELQNLNTLTGTLAALQKMECSNTVETIRHALVSLVTPRLTAKERLSFTKPPYIIGPEDSVVFKKLKLIANHLFELENAIKVFDKCHFAQGVLLNVRHIVGVCVAACNLVKSVRSLSPEVQRVLSPIQQQIMTVATSLSTISNQKGPDLSLLEAAKKPATNSLMIADYITLVSQIRTHLLKRFKTRLTTPLSHSLNPQESGVPFINLDGEAPQLIAIKKIINSLYYAELALKAWQSMDVSTSLGKVTAAHQGVTAMSQIFKALELFAAATPEMRKLLHDNDDLIKLLLKGAQNIIASSSSPKQFDLWGNIAQKVGTLLGQGIKLIQPDASQSAQMSPLVNLFSQLPLLMKNIQSSLNPAGERSPPKLPIPQDKIDAISAALELVLEEDSFFLLKLFNLKIFKVPSAIWGLKELNQKFKAEGSNLDGPTIQAYQQWVEFWYPKLLLMLDKLETRFYLKPGTLSDPIIAEFDPVNDKLNERIEAKPGAKTGLMKLSNDIDPERVKSLREAKKGHLFGIFQIEEQQQAAQTFFKILKKYNGKTAVSIIASDWIDLRAVFARIQPAMAHCCLELSNEFVNALNQINPQQPTPKLGASIVIDHVLKQEPLVQQHLAQQQRAAQLKIEVVNTSINYIRVKYVGREFKITPEDSVSELRVQYQATHPKADSGVLQLTPTFSLYNVRGNLAYLQELELSSVIPLIRAQASEIRDNKFAPLVLQRLIKPVDQALYLIKDTEPKIVRLIKGFENSLIHLETALRYFEQMKKSDSLVSHARAFVEMTHAAQQVSFFLQKLTPELQELYGPLIQHVLAYTKRIQSLDRNQEDLKDLQYILQNTKKELLKRKAPKALKTVHAFFDAEYNKVSEPPVTVELITRKATRLAVKYLYKPSPPLERAQTYLRSRYPTTFGIQKPTIRILSRNQLANEAFMNAQSTRLQIVLEKSYGFNLDTVNALMELIGQMQRVATQASELSHMTNTLLTEDFVQIKKRIYEELIIKLSRKEDYLCLKPGTLIKRAMTVIDELFLSAALELDMPFAKKQAILDDATFINIIMKQTQNDLSILIKERIKQAENDLTPLTKERKPRKQTQDDLGTMVKKQHKTLVNDDITLKIAIKKDKLAYCKRLLKSIMNKEDTKAALLEFQYDVYERDLLNNSNIKKPIADQYKQAIRTHYDNNQKQWVSLADSAGALYKSLQTFKRETENKYAIVYETYRRLHTFSMNLSDSNKDVKEYINGITAGFENKDLPIDDRLAKIKSLPDDHVFMEKLSSVEGGINFLRKFIHFIASVFESIGSGMSVMYLYNQKTMYHFIETIEQTFAVNSDDNSPSEGAGPDDAVPDEAVPIEEEPNEDDDLPDAERDRREARP